MKIDLEKEKKEILRQYRSLLRAIKPSKKDPNSRKKIRKAFDVALEAHKDMRRRSGEPYIYHPLAVAKICAQEIGLGTTSIICALLHDTVEDTDITLKDIRKMFGDKICQIIDGLTKISVVEDKNVSLQAENFRKVLLTLSEDIRVILIKIADRLHNMRTLDSMSREKQLKIASETLFLYAPLAHRLGLYSIKTELEDLALKYTHPDEYNDIKDKLEKSKEVRERFIRRFIIPIKKALNEHGFNFSIKGRTKSIYSIWNKMKKKNVPFEEIYDVFAIRIIIDSEPEKEKSDCWHVYSIVTDFYQPNPDRLRDWISVPKSNGYESLHTTVMSPTGKWVEVQIRTKRMDEIAEKGFAAHWKYKEGTSESQFDAWLNQIREILENPDSNAIDFVDDFKLNLLNDEIYVFTPKGEMKTLPINATALDFAFSIHTQVGMQCLGAKVNNKLVPLSHPLKSGDQVEIITSSKQKPKEDWLKFVITHRAKSKIKSALKEEQRKIANEGKLLLSKELKKKKLSLNDENLNELLKFYKCASSQELYVKIANRQINIHGLKDFIIKDGKLTSQKDVSHKKEPQLTFNELLALKGKSSDEMLVIGDDMQKIDYKLSPCCNPIPGDEVFGFITVSDGIKIHKTTCPNAIQLMSNFAYRIVKARWTSKKQIAFLAGIKITGIDEMGIVNKITQIISSQLNVNMRSISFDSQDGIFEGIIMVFVHDTQHLKELIEKLKQVEGVINITRIDN